MGITNMIGDLGTAVSAAAPSVPRGIRPRYLSAQAHARGASWQPAPVQLTVLPIFTDKCTGVSVSGRRYRH